MNPIESSFPQTRHDLSNLKKTAVDAARDIGDSASAHAKKAQGHLQDLATHAQEEGEEQLDQAKMGLSGLGDQVGHYIAARPFASIGTALVVGFLFGTFRRGRSRASE